ncbi:hypothetical protein R9C00_03380 [Flammeovirgaceae bacterium SG7u.111]|nr:hypothetical protein [Flammeovirgaceae bacterium SG7u.132]WPO36485.1 hypothetical protein R9C00_03380 [Flammeovirgaceae bacterium SG7u.111]
MSNCCDDIANPLVRDGKSQNSREPQALAPEKAMADSRELIDFMHFAYRFANLVKYYPLSGELPKDFTPNWQAFFEKETSFLIAIISKTETDLFRRELDESLAKIFQNPSKEAINGLVGKLLDAALLVDSWHMAIAARSGLKLLLRQSIQAKLAPALQIIKAIDRAVLPEQTEKYAKFRTPELKVIAEQPAGNSFQNADISTLIVELQRNAEVIYKELVYVTGSAPNYLEESLAYQDLPPHIALFISFVKILIKNVQTDFNKVTQQHLDFFYRKVLRLKEKDAIPDSAHLIFELAKHIEEHKVSKGTLFTAGKDDAGDEILFGLDEEIIVNKTQVASLQTLYIDRVEGNDGTKYIKDIYAASVANSGDGLGGDFENEEVPTWKTLGGNGVGEKPALGFLISSEMLLLSEGTRTITFTFTYEAGTFDSQLEPFLNADLFQISLTGEKGWIEGFSEKEELQFTTEANKCEGNTIELKVILENAAPAIFPFDPKVIEEESYDTSLPVAKVLLNKDLEIPLDTDGSIHVSPYHFLKKLVITDLNLLVSVEGMSTILAKSDLGLLDTTKPFMPFGAQPKNGSSFFVGSKEFENKEIETVSLGFEWEALPNDEDYTLYEKSDPVPASNASFTINPGGSTSEVIFINGEINGLAELLFQEDTINGGAFFEMRLEGDFGHDQFAAIYARQAMALALQDSTGSRKLLTGAYYQNPDDGGVLKFDGNEDTTAIDDTWPVPLPATPYTPVLKKLTLGYTASSELKEFTQLHAFGGYKKVQTGDEKKNYLLPQYDEEGSLYIGLRDLPPQSVLPLLFQVEEATANAELARAKVSWSYLENDVVLSSDSAEIKKDDWVKFPNINVLSDESNGLIASGVVTLEIPKEIGRENTVFGEGLSWLKVSAAERTGAVPQTLQVHTQVAKASFVLSEVDNSRLQQPLEAGSIAKFVENDISIKSVAQPYDSFGGRPPEEPIHFYTRVSERLRHKGRAITIFDYERLVLENFPNIYKARCITHTNIEKELAPGFVTLAVIPDQRGKKVLNPLEPQANINELADIEAFLKKRTTPHARIKVKNPKYETIKVKFDVKFIVGKSFDFYKKELSIAISKYLSPWAFEEGKEILFGGKVYRSSILNFVEEQAYVDYVLNFEMYHNEKGINISEAVPTTSRTILTSVDGHDISEVTSEKLGDQGLEGKDGMIGYAEIGEEISDETETN